MEKSVTFDAGLEYGATFRFPVTWSYLTATPHPASPNPVTAAPPKARTLEPKARILEVVEPPPVKVPPPAPPPVEEPLPVTVEAKSEPARPGPTPESAAGAVAVIPTQEPSPTQEPGPLRTPKPEAKWEMVIPKMARPITSLTARSPRTLQAAAQPAAPAAVAETPISFYAGSEASFVPPRWKVLSLCAAAVVVGCVIAWVRPGAGSASGSESAPAAAGTWSRRTAYLVGATNPREILVYSGSDDVKNYRVEFAWVPDPRGVGLIFRASDSANYYAAKLRLMQAGAIPTLSAEHFTVVKGVEGTHSRKVITLGRTQGEVMVRMDATGPTFTLFLQGIPADYWTDDRFEAGSLGFYEERGETPALQALRFSFFRKSGLQTVVTSLQ